MATLRDRLKHEVTVAAGLEHEPTDKQLEAVISDMAVIAREEGPPTKNDWAAVAAKHIPRTGKVIRAGENLSTLNMLLSQILNQGGSSYVKK